MAKQVIIVKPDSLTAKDKEKLSKNGYIVIEHPFPQDVRIVTQVEGHETGLILKSLAEGVKKAASTRTEECVGEALAENILASIIHNQA